jgi:methyltransferase (TIGR00027 family)
MSESAGSLGTMTTSKSATPESTTPESAVPQSAALESKRASQTALTAAAARAAHLIVDAEPIIFADTLAARLLGDQADTFLDYHRNHGSHTVLAGARAQVTVRARVAEDRVAAGLARGIDQYVILGAGLDSFAYRSDLPLRVFEVDHPASQAWKRQRLDDAGIPIPASVTYVGVDFETEPMRDALLRGGFDPHRPAIVSWLGVTMYLSRTAIADTLGVIGSFASGTELVLDYMLTAELRDEAGQTYADLIAPVTAERGEPWLSFFRPDDMSSLLSAAGFGAITHTRQRDIDAALWDRTDALRPAELSVLARASVI